MNFFSFKNKYALTTLAILALVSYSFIVYAAAPSGGYAPGATLNPDCAPGSSVDCVVTLPTGSGLIGSTSGVTSSPTPSGTRFETWLGQRAGLNATTDHNDHTVLIGVDAGNGTNYDFYSNFIGAEAGMNTSSDNHSNYIGYQAGKNTSNSYYANFIGYGAGDGSNDAIGSVFIGAVAGKNASGSASSTFVGNGAGINAQNSISSVFLGDAAGYGASDASLSVFIGSQAGITFSGGKKAHAIFIGATSGFNDQVDNVTTPGTSILIGEGTLTGGHSNSIGLGTNAVNTMSNQFLVASSYVNWQIAGVDYVWPTSQAAGAGYVLTNDSAGNLSWAPAGSGSGTVYDDKQIVFGDGSTAGGVTSPNFLWNNSSSRFVTAGASGAEPVIDADYHSGLPIVTIGANGYGNETNLFLSDNHGTARLGSSLLQSQLSITGDMGLAQLGDGFGMGNNTLLTVNDGSQFITLAASTGTLIQDNVGNTWLNVNPSGSTVSLGNLGAPSGTTFTIDDVGESYTFSKPNFAINGVNYIWTGSQATSYGDVLTNDGSGNLFWAQPPGGGGIASQTCSVGDFVTGFDGTNFNCGAGGWSLTGNAGTDGGTTNFIGTTDAQDFVIKTDSLEVAHFYNDTSANSYSISLGQESIATDAGMFVAGGGAGTNSSTSANSIWMGNSTGYNTDGATSSIFIGDTAGQYADSANDSVFMGTAAGNNASSSFTSNFIGYNAGNGAASSEDSNFIGTHAGDAASGSHRSNFIGAYAGQNSTGSGESNFIGYYAGYGVTGAFDSNFIGGSAGYGADQANQSNFIGPNAGYNATNANQSNFIGGQAGQDAQYASFSSFMGYQAGYGATYAADSVFLGRNAGQDAAAASNSIFVGKHAGQSASNASNSIFIGYNSGSGDSVDNTFGDSSILIGNGSLTGGFSNSIALGTNATNTAVNQFLIAPSYVNWQIAGVDYVWPNAQAGGPGYVLTNDGSGTLTWSTGGGLIGSTSGITNSPVAGVTEETWLGAGAGSSGAEMENTVFIGVNAGSGAAGRRGIIIGRDAGVNSVGGSNVFIGNTAGNNAVAGGATFIGDGAGLNSTLSSGSIFMGRLAGSATTNATGSIFIGQQAGEGDTVDNLTVPGTSILIGNDTRTGGYSNSIALGKSAINSATNQFMVGSSSSPIDQFVMVGSGGATCSLDANGTSCSSDERLKTNISDLTTNALDTLTKVRTVTFNWINGADSNQHLGFIAQDIQQFYPQLVSTASNGYLTVNYAGITPVLVESIRELNLKLIDIQNFAAATDKTFLNTLIAWLGNGANGITDLFAKNIHSDSVTTAQLCVGSTCISETDLQKFKTWEASQPQTPQVSPSGGGSSDPAPSGDSPAPSDNADTLTPDASQDGAPVVDAPADSSSSDPVAPSAPQDSGAPAPAPSDAPAVAQ
ncbi:MAG: hypothetical protein JWM20_948 [Patescibacteria group bacterium]|nr:hypothetical protein [Patescibacteria group bacterium]